MAMVGQSITHMLCCDIFLSLHLLCILDIYVIFAAQGNATPGGGSGSSGGGSSGGDAKDTKKLKL